MPRAKTRSQPARSSKTARRSKAAAAAKSSSSSKRQSSPSSSSYSSEAEGDSKVKDDSPSLPPSYLEAPSSFLDTYPVTVNEIGVLTVEPYKSALLPLWRFRTPDIARESATALEERFAAYGAQKDFVGMDMARKFIQMGMTRAKRYANYQGGRKYVDGKQREKSQGHAGKDDKEEASMIFRSVWERCKADETYLSLKEGFLSERKKFKAKR